MGQAIIVQEYGDGEYGVYLQYAGIDAQIAALANRRAQLETQLPTLRDALTVADQARQTARAAADQALLDWQAGLDPLPTVLQTPAVSDTAQAYVDQQLNVLKIPKALIDSIGAVAQAGMDYYAANTALNTAYADYLSVITREAELLRLQQRGATEIRIWCADYVQGLTGTVATIEVPGEVEPELGGGINIRPGYLDRATWSASYGKLQWGTTLSAAGFAWNLVMLMPWMKWQPRWRYATVLNKGEVDDTLDIVLVPIYSKASAWLARQTDFNLPWESSMTGVTADYMDRGAMPFAVADEVLVEFTEERVGDYLVRTPKIIGFQDHPKLGAGFVTYPKYVDAVYGMTRPFITDTGEGLPMSELFDYRQPFANYYCFGLYKYERAIHSYQYDERVLSGNQFFRCTNGDVYSYWGSPHGDLAISYVAINADYMPYLVYDHREDIAVGSWKRHHVVIYKIGGVEKIVPINHLYKNGRLFAIVGFAIFGVGVVTGASGEKVVVVDHDGNCHTVQRQTPASMIEGGFATTARIPNVGSAIRRSYSALSGQPNVALRYSDNYQQFFYPVSQYFSSMVYESDLLFYDYRFSADGKYLSVISTYAATSITYRVATAEFIPDNTQATGLKLSTVSGVEKQIVKTDSGRASGDVSTFDPDLGPVGLMHSYTKDADNPNDFRYFESSTYSDLVGSFRTITEVGEIPIAIAYNKENQLCIMNYVVNSSTDETTQNELEGHKNYPAPTTIARYWTGISFPQATVEEGIAYLGTSESFRKFSFTGTYSSQISKAITWNGQSLLLLTGIDETSVYAEWTDTANINLYTVYTELYDAYAVHYTGNYNATPGYAETMTRTQHTHYISLRYADAATGTLFYTAAQKTEDEVQQDGAATTTINCQADIFRKYLYSNELQKTDDEVYSLNSTETTDLASDIVAYRRGVTVINPLVTYSRISDHITIEAFNQTWFVADERLPSSPMSIPWMLYERIAAFQSVGAIDLQNPDDLKIAASFTLTTTATDLAPIGLC